MTMYRNQLRDKATIRQVLQGFVDRLRQIPDLNSENVILSDQAVPDAFPLGGMCLVVAPADGVFDISVGAHHASFTENTGAIVACYIRNNRDRYGRSESKLMADSMLLDWKLKILKYLALKDVALGAASQGWEPTIIVGSDEIPLLRNQPLPTKATSPRDVDNQVGWIGMQIYYALEFDWDLYD
jgi:hypothetical protein